MLVNARGVVGVLCLLPFAAATVLPREAGAIKLIKVAARDLERRVPQIIIGGGEESSTSNTRSTSTTTTTSTPTPTSTTTSTTTSTPTPTSTTPPVVPTTTTSTTTSRTPVTSALSTTDENGEPITYIVTVSAPNTPTPSATRPASNNNESDSGPGKGTYIGLGVAGGIALIGLVGFIVWKMNQKRFSQFDDDGGDINWPLPKEQLVPPAAPSTHAATNATNSSVDLTTRDPYAVPPLPAAAMPYYDDPSAGAAYYDPYRGPVPQTFQSPPPSTEGHVNNYAGEAIPMSTYSTSGRQSPGPNAMGADPYARGRSPGPAMAVDPYARSRSPGPAMAYDDPHAAGRRSPGPALAYGVADPMGMRGGTPMGAPPRVGTPVGVGYGGVPPGLDVPRVGTPTQGGYAMGYGRASPAPPGAGYSPHSPLVDPYGRRTPGAYGP